MALKKCSRRTLMTIIVIVILIVAVIWIFLANIQPVILEMSEAKISAIAVTAMNKAVIDVMSQDVSFKDLINVYSDASGQTTMIQTNTVKMNEMGVKTAQRAQEEINRESQQQIMIPAGSALGINAFAGSGPKIPVKIVPVGNVSTSFVTDFENAGINQTRFRVSMLITARVALVLPTDSKTVEITTQALVTETIIVGNVPQNYVNVDETDKMLNLIPDVGD
ncbi:MAG: sporulation protein YunB [Christensenellales bacterium]